jgi:hypothetical protein
MRSELIFKALGHETNRYQLCRLIAKSTRRLHRPNTRIQDTTNEVLEFYSNGHALVETKMPERPPIEHRRAA